MSDPFAPKTIVKPSTPRVDMTHPPLDRLRKLGASQTVLDEVGQRWGELTPQERRDSAADFEAMTDHEVQGHLPAMEAFVVARAVIGGEPSDALVEAAVAHVGDKVGGTAREIARYVEDDKPKALAALVVELRRMPGDQRKTVIEHLHGVLRAG